MAEGMQPVRAGRVGFEKDRGVLAIRTEAALSFLRVTLDASQAGEAPALQALRPLAERGLSIRFVKVDADCLSFVASGEHLPAVREVLLGAGVPFEVSEGCAVVTVDAPNVRSIPSIMARTVEALYLRAIEIFQTADSHSWVSCVVPSERLAEAVTVLRGEFGLAAESGADAPLPH